MHTRVVPHELRRAARVRSKGSITIRHGARAIRARVVDLATGGICARTNVTCEPIVRVGEPVDVDLRLDAQLTRPFSLHGRVVRANAATRVIVIGFDSVPAGFDACVQDELHAAIEHDASPDMILVDSQVARRGPIANAFRDAGCRVTEVSTPLEAIARLDASRFEPGIIAIADTVPESIAEDLRELLLARHSDAHMVEIGRSASGRSNHAATWLGLRDHRGDSLQIRVGRVMTAHGSRCGATTSRRLWSNARLGRSRRSRARAIALLVPGNQGSV